MKRPLQQAYATISLLGLLRLALLTLVLFAPGIASANGFFAVVTKEPAPLIQWYEQAFDARLVRTIKPEGRDITIYILDAPHVTIEVQHRANAIQHPERANARQGIMKTGFTVAAIEPWLERWRAMNARVIAGPFDDTAPPMRSVVLLDPDGNSIHVTTRLDGPEAAFAAHVAAIITRNIEALERTITSGDELTLILPNGKMTTTRNEYLDIHRKLFAAKDWSLEFEPVSVVTDGEMAIITTKGRYREQVEGTTIENHNLVTFIFRRESGGWKLVHDQNTRMPDAGK